MGSPSNLKNFKKKHFWRRKNLNKSWKSTKIDKNCKNQLKSLSLWARARNLLQIWQILSSGDLNPTHFVKKTMLRVRIFPSYLVRPDFWDTQVGFPGSQQLRSAWSSCKMRPCQSRCQIDLQNGIHFPTTLSREPGRCKKKEREAVIRAGSARGSWTGRDSLSLFLFASARLSRQSS